MGLSVEIKISDWGATFYIRISPSGYNGNRVQIGYALVSTDSSVLRSHRELTAHALPVAGQTILALQM